MLTNVAETAAASPQMSINLELTSLPATPPPPLPLFRTQAAPFRHPWQTVLVALKSALHFLMLEA